jgi:hypothetical protein
MRVSRVRAVAFYRRARRCHAKLRGSRPCRAAAPGNNEDSHCAGGLSSPPRGGSGDPPARGNRESSEQLDMSARAHPETMKMATDGSHKRRCCRRPPPTGGTVPFSARKAAEKGTVPERRHPPLQQRPLRYPDLRSSWTCRAAAPGNNEDSHCAGGLSSPPRGGSGDPPARGNRESSEQPRMPPSAAPGNDEDTQRGTRVSRVRAVAFHRRARRCHADLRGIA